MQEYGLYELYTKALKVTHKKNKVAFKDRYFKLHIVLQKAVSVTWFYLYVAF